MDKKEAKKEIYDFLRKELKISTKDIYKDKASDYLWTIFINSDVYTHTIFFEFSKDYVRCYIRDIPSRICRTNYDNEDLYFFGQSEELSQKTKDFIKALIEYFEGV